LGKTFVTVAALSLLLVSLFSTGVFADTYVVDTQSDFGNGTFDKTSADRDDSSGDLGLGYTYASNSKSWLPQNSSIIGQWELAKDYGTSSTGDTVPDRSGNGNDATTNGVDTTANGVFSSGAYSFDGTDDYVDTGIGSWSYDNVTISAWIKTSFGGDNQLIVGADQNSPGKRTFQFRVDSGGTARAIFFHSGASDTQPKSTTNVNDGNWHHFVATYDSSQAKIYVDSVEEDSRSVSGGLDTGAPVEIGKRVTDKSYFNGNISNVQIWNQALSQSQVEELYLQGQSGNFNGTYESDNLRSGNSTSTGWGELNVSTNLNSQDVNATVEVSDDDFSTVKDSTTFTSVVDGHNSFDISTLQDGDDIRVQYDFTSSDETQTTEVTNYNISTTTTAPQGITLSNPQPSDGSTNVDVNTTLSILYENAQNNNANVTFEVDNQNVYTENNVANGTTVTTNSLSLNYNQSHSWSVTATSTNDTETLGNFTINTRTSTLNTLSWNNANPNTDDDFDATGQFNDSDGLDADYKIIRERSGTNTTLTDTTTTTDDTGSFTTQIVSSSNTEIGDTLYVEAFGIDSETSNRASNTLVANVTVQNRDPVINELSFDRGSNAVTTQDFKTRINTEDLDGQNLNVSYDFVREQSGSNTTIDTGTITNIAQNQLVDLANETSGDTQADDTYYINTSVTDGISTVENTTSLDVISGIANVTKVSFNDSNVFTNEDVAVNTTLDDVNNGDIQVLYTYERNNNQFNTGTENTYVNKSGSYVFTLPTISSSSFSQEDNITVLVEPENTNDEVIGSSDTNSFIVQNNLPSIDSGRFDPTPVINGSSVDFIVDSSDADGDNLYYNYWVNRTRSGTTTTIINSTLSNVTTGEVTLDTLLSNETEVGDTLQFYAVVNDTYNESSRFSSGVQTVQTFTNFTINAEDVWTNQLLNNFTAVVDYNGTTNTYNTSSGQIITSIDEENRFANVTVGSDESGGYFDQRFIDVNTSNVLDAKLHQSEVTFTPIRKVSRDVFSDEQSSFENTFDGWSTGTTTSQYSTSPNRTDSWSSNRKKSVRIDAASALNGGSGYIEKQINNEFLLVDFNATDLQGGDTNSVVFEVNGNIAKEVDVSRPEDVRTNVLFDNFTSGDTVRILAQPELGFDMELYVDNIREFGNGSNISNKFFDVNVSDGTNSRVYNVTEMPSKIDSGNYTYDLDVDGGWSGSGSLSVNALESRLEVVNVSNSNLSITGEDGITNQTISDFSGWVSADNYAYNESYTANGSLANLSIEQGLNYTVFFKHPDYSVTQQNYKKITNASSSETINYRLLKNRSINIEFREELTQNLIDYQNISVEIFSEAESRNLTVTNGSVYVNFLAPQNYTIVYDSDSELFGNVSKNFTRRQYQTEITENSASNLTLYLLERDETDEVLVEVIDRNARSVENAEVELLRYYVGSNQYKPRGGVLMRMVKRCLVLSCRKSFTSGSFIRMVSWLRRLSLVRYYVIVFYCRFVLVRTLEQDLTIWKA